VRLAVVALLAVAVTWPTADRPVKTADLTINAPADMEFRSLGLNPDAWRGPRTFKSLPPGRVVVVQAPPVPGFLQIVCSDGEGNEHFLRAGDDVHCTFTVE
jgi:hypothetical protein